VSKGFSTLPEPKSNSTQKNLAEWERDVSLSRNELALFTRQLAVMLQAGVSLRSSLEVLSSGAADEASSVVMNRLLTCVEAGWMLSSALKCFPRVFGKVYLAMIEVGEETGQIVRTLMNLADWLDSEEALVRKVRGALTYPTIVLCAAAFLTIVFFTWIFPSFAESLAAVENLPKLTVVLIGISDLLRSPIFWMIGLVALLLGLKLGGEALRVPANRLAVWRVLNQIPILSLVLRDFAASRFSSAMAIMLQTGVDILKSFRLASMASGSPLLLSQTDEGLLFLSHGGDLADFMKDHPEIFPCFMTGLVLVGQESASLPEMFEKLQRSLTEDTEYRLDILTSLLEPFLMAFVALLVGLLVIGVAMPMYGLVNAAL
jgi:type IV pilus assembly protein PilC